MATSSNADSATASGPNADAVGASDSTREPGAHGELPAHDESDSDGSASAMLDRLETAARAVRLAFLGVVVLLALVPAVALWFGAAPFDAPPARPYFAFVLASLVGTAALIVGAIYDA